MNILILHVLFLIHGFASHPVHVSLCNLEFTGNESLITIKLFSDDFERVIENKSGSDFVLSKSDEKPFRDYISEYVRSNLKLFTKDGDNLAFSFDYSEKDDLSIWLYFKAGKIPSSEPLKIVNTLMLDLYEDQTNLVIVNHGSIQKGFEFNDHVTELEIELK